MRPPATRPSDSTRSSAIKLGPLLDLERHSPERLELGITPYASGFKPARIRTWDLRFRSSCVLDEIDRANASALVPELRAIRERRPAEETASGSIAPTDRVYADNHEAVAKATTEPCEDRIAGTGFPRPQ